MDSALAGVASSPLLMTAKLDSRGRMFHLLNSLRYNRQCGLTEWSRWLIWVKLVWYLPPLKFRKMPKANLSYILRIILSKWTRIIWSKYWTTGSPSANARQSHVLKYPAQRTPERRHPDRQKARAATFLCFRIIEKPLHLKIPCWTRLLLIRTSIPELKPS